MQRQAHRQGRRAASRRSSQKTSGREQSPRVPARQRPCERVAPGQPREIELRGEDARDRRPEQEHPEHTDRAAVRGPADLQTAGGLRCCCGGHQLTATVVDSRPGVQRADVHIARPVFISPGCGSCSPDRVRDHMSSLVASTVSTRPRAIKDRQTCARSQRQRLVIKNRSSGVQEKNTVSPDLLRLLFRRQAAVAGPSAGSTVSTRGFHLQVEVDRRRHPSA